MPKTTDGVKCFHIGVGFSNFKDISDLISELMKFDPELVLYLYIEEEDINEIVAFIKMIGFTRLAEKSKITIIVRVIYKKNIIEYWVEDGNDSINGSRILYIIQNMIKAKNYQTPTIN